MNATVAELQHGASEMIRAVQRGEEIVVTESGEPVAKIIPMMRVVTVTPDEARRGGDSGDDGILRAIREDREEYEERLDP